MAAARDGSNRLITAVPAESRIELRLPRSAGVEALLTHAFELPAALLHGSRQRFAGAQNLRLLRRRTVESLFDLLAGNSSPDETAADFRRFEHRRQMLRSRWVPMYRSIDGALMHWVLRDPGYTDHYAETLSAASGYEMETLRKDIEERYQSEKTDVPEQWVFDTLREITLRHGLAVAETVADAAMDTPSLAAALEPVDVPAGVSIRPLEQFEFDDRLRHASDVIEGIDDPSSRLRTDLRRHLHEELDGVAAPERGWTTPRQGWLGTDVPLLDMPTATADPVTSIEIESPPVPESTAPVSHVVARCLLQAGYGGLTYRGADGAWSWIVNPRSATPQGDAYEKRWQRALLGTAFVDAVDAAARSREPDRLSALSCPLCERSRRQCAGDACGCSDTIETARRCLPAVARTLSNGGVENL